MAELSAFALAPRKRSILYFSFGFLIGAATDLFGLLAEFQFQAMVTETRFLGIAGADLNELLSTLITALLSALVGLQLAKYRTRELNLQQEVANNRENLAAMIAKSPFAKIVLDAAGRVVFANSRAERFFSGVEGFRVGEPFTLFAPEEKEIQVGLASGEEGVFRAYVTPLRWDAGPARLISLLDIKQEKELAALRDDVERMVRHDMKSPLNGIIGLSEVLLLNPELPQEPREYVTLINESGRKLLEMMNESMVLLAIELGTYEFPKQKVALGGVVLKVAEHLGHLGKGKGVACDIALPESGDEVFGEDILLYMLVANLVKNAMEASPEGETVRIALEVSDMVRLSIRNTGELSEEGRRNFFGKYYTFGKKEGTGLGTYIAKRIAETLGGRIRLDASAPGTIQLTVELPLACADSQARRLGATG